MTARKTVSRLTFSSLISAVVLAGCVALGPYAPYYGEGMAEKILNALPPEDSNLIFFATGLWTLQISGVNGGVINQTVHAAIALTDNNLYLEQWNSARGRLEVTKRIDLKTIETAVPRRSPVQVMNFDCNLQIFQTGGHVDVVTVTHADISYDCSRTKELRLLLLEQE